MSTSQLLVHSLEFHAKFCFNSSARSRSMASLRVPAACVSYPHLLDYSLKVTSRKWCNIPHVTRIHGNDPEFSVRIYWFTSVCDHHYLPTYFLISFRVVFLRNDCSVTNRAQLTHWKKTYEMKPGKLTTRHWDAVSTTCSAASRYTWRRMVVTSSSWCNVIFFQHETNYVSYQYCHILLVHLWHISKCLGFVLYESLCIL